MINARESLDLLLGSGKLEGLLQAARVKVAKIDKKNARPDTDKQASELEQRVSDAKKLSAEAIAGLRSALDAKVASRAEKVAIVRHLLHFGSKLDVA
jgi:hypothetical protein